MYDFKITYIIPEVKRRQEKKKKKEGERERVASVNTR